VHNGRIRIRAKENRLYDVSDLFITHDLNDAGVVHKVNAAPAPTTPLVERFLVLYFYVAGITATATTSIFV
jgi:hypothetical protein